jgi:hypothetical protein
VAGEFFMKPSFLLNKAILLNYFLSGKNKKNEKLRLPPPAKKWRPPMPVSSPGDSPGLYQPFESLVALQKKSKCQARKR